MRLYSSMGDVRNRMDIVKDKRVQQQFSEDYCSVNHCSLFDQT